MSLAVSLTLLVPVSAQTAPEDQHFLHTAAFNASLSRRISMDFKGASMNDVLKVFSKQSGLNFIAEEDVSAKKVTLYIENISVEEALKKILDTNGLTYEMQEGSNIFVVRAKNTSNPVVTRIYQLKHATVPSSKINATINLGTTISASTSSSSSSSSASGSSSSSSAASGAYASGIYAAIRASLSKTGSMIEDPRTNSLIITDAQNQFPIIEATIAKLDVPVAQILIQVEMLDISKVTSDLMGVKWGSALFSFTGAQKATIWPFNQSDYLKKAGTTQPLPETDSSSSSSSTDTSPYKVGTLDASGMTAVVNFLQSRSDTRNLARPRILTLNNETAEIKISTDEAIGITTTTVGGSSTSTTSIEAERKPTGVFLTVTPQADLDGGEILMAINPKVIQARTGATFEGKTFKDVEERSTQSLLRVKDGQTIIVGGLMRTDDGGTVTKLPVLGNVPLLGSLFRHKDKSGSKRELVVFLTPHIIRDSAPDPLVHQTVQQYERESNNPTQTAEAEKALSTIEGQRY